MQLPKFSNFEDGLTLISYNVLLPNSGKAWWIYKYYQSNTPYEHREWLHRQSLLKDYLLNALADIVCIQEVDGETFDKDFAFLGFAGYDHVLHRKYRFRNATFWRKDRLALVEVQHRDRVLVTRLRSSSDHTRRYLYVVNCHLTAGPAPDRRLRQVFSGIDQVRKEAQKLGQDPTDTATIVCGDFNSSSNHTAVRKLLLDGEVDPDFREKDYPDIRIALKLKRQILGTFVDAYEQAYGRDKQPPTLLLPLLDVRFVNPISGELTLKFVEAISTMFAYFSQGADIMDQTTVETWLNKINQEPKLSSEYDSAMEIFEQKGSNTLTLYEFLSIYEKELREGKFWSVHHDMQVCGVAIKAPSAQPFEACFDHIYYTNKILNLQIVREPLSDEQRRLVYEKGEVLPNSWHPSDHLPLAVAFSWIGCR
jgi:mRNA deadenylase 3'-5' endonuclease subunit Ccr4